MGNKIDRDDHEIPGDIGEDFANRHGMYFLQTSAKNCDNVDRLFTEIAHELLQQVTQKYFSSSPPLERDTGFSSEKIHNVLDVDQYQAKQNDKISMRKAVKCNVMNNFSDLELNISLPTPNVIIAISRPRQKICPVSPTAFKISPTPPSARAPQLKAIVVPKFCNSTLRHFSS